MMKRFTLLLALVFLFASCKTTQKATQELPTNIEAKVAIAQVMNMQEEAWSAGNIEQVREGYWKSPNLKFVSSKGITYGWENTYFNYKRGYPNKEVMGTLQFDILHLEALSPDTYHMTGQFTLIREADRPSGYFTLVWKYIDGKWVIISDHTSG